MTTQIISMKKIILLFVIIFGISISAEAQSKFGLGIIAGEPTGISAKMKLTDESFVDGAVGWSFAKYSSVHIHADYLINVKKFATEVPFYVGIGGRIKIKNNDKKEDTRVAVRVPVGLAYEPSTVPIYVFFEVVPMLDVSPATELNWNAAIGIRYYFN